MRLTSGFILHVDDKILACHATGRPWENGNYDIPKGLVEEGEEPLETAIRELREETGIILSDYKYNITDLGEYPYLKDKAIHIFDLYIDDFDMNRKLVCEPHF